MTSRDLAINHDRHDLLLVAALASGDAAPAERDRAEQLVARCDACAELVRDLRAIATATTAVSLPVPERPRAFTLSPTDARRLRPAGWRAVLGRLGSPGWSFTRPLAAGLTTLGLAGLLVAALPGGLGGAAAAPGSGAAEQRDATIDQYASPGQPFDPSAAPPGAEPSGALPSYGVSSGEGHGVTGTPAASSVPDAEQGRSPAAIRGDGDPAVDGVYEGAEAADDTLSATVPRDGPSMLAIVAGTMLLVGLGLFALRWAARRLT